MERKTENKIVLVTRRTRLDELISRFNTEDQARFYIGHSGADFSDYKDEDLVYKQAVRATQGLLSIHGRLQVIDRSFVPNFIFGPEDTVVVLGQDGLVANVLKYLDGHPLVGVNPDPGRWEGVLLPFEVEALDDLMPELFSGRRPFKRVTMAEARLNSGEVIHGVNDLFIGPRSHTSARYVISVGGMSERHSSSGVIVSTGLGSTGWFRSILSGAKGIYSTLSRGSIFSDSEIQPMENFEWDSDFLRFSVREPWPSTTTGAEIVFGTISAAEPLTLVSQMPENGVIFSDGIESDFVSFNSGAEAVVSVARKKGTLVV